ncbi:MULTISPECIES: gamma-glutamyl-gamma-aminobutyrate hydrolase family protein [unclassified Brevibacterium]|uniref:anthranilate synthase component II n=1 Tax=unclassified Brevibacterium TaxID=2614124 RepID=UPI001E63FE21|nr:MULTISPECIES: gamma-glutamyl-gamma-aminobutyrate hydrolase family protein [unclassified Brevibacterium]MCD1286336.1 anthranilate synthase component II [Brevibacterium sp. CCUG 69071]MDK8433702.1 gamma-glutamyl-gamma-aminobutyrate hydrolase family protein [Brevibacterium sp. H-BE7]
MTKILVIDNYDSFVYTLVAYVRELGAEVDVIRNDDIPAEAVPETAGDYDGILLSPGPGVPAESGVCLALISWAETAGKPVFGVCLGHQALGEVFGATVSHSPVLMHGKTSVITHDGEGIFFGCPNPLTVTRYHSLAIVDETLDLEKFTVTARTQDGIVMAIEHREQPLFGVQFHPESVLTESGYLMLGNWLEVCGLAGAAERAAKMSPLATAIS